MRIAAVVVTYNRRDLLTRCLTALKQQTHPVSEIIVVDNASTDGTAAVIAHAFPTLTYVRLPENTGSTGGFHAGIKLAHGRGHDWIWVMDDDAIPMSNALERLVHSEPFSWSDTAALSSGVYEADGRLSRQVRHARVDRSNCISFEACHEGNYGLTYFECDQATFVGLLLQRNAVSQVGYPNRDFFIYWDDVDYTLRVSKLGQSLMSCRSNQWMNQPIRQAPMPTARAETPSHGIGTVMGSRTSRIPKDGRPGSEGTIRQSSSSCVQASRCGG